MRGGFDGGGARLYDIGKQEWREASAEGQKVGHFLIEQKGRTRVLEKSKGKEGGSYAIESGLEIS